MADPHDKRPEPIDMLVRAFDVFAKNKTSGAILLLLATVLAIGWANSPWVATYHDLLHTEIALRIGGFELAKSVLHWVNDGLMGLFFFAVGLEIKREILAGELSSLRKALLPMVAAIGGMAVPALVYAALNPSGPAARGWGVPMATDIAFALGLLALLQGRVPTSVKVFLTAVAIIDDIGAIAVIAIFYTDAIAVESLAVGGLLFLVSIGANLAGVRNSIVYWILGTLVWLAFLKSGVHATLAAVLMALTIPARTRLDGQRFTARIRGLVDRLMAGDALRAGRLLTPEQQHVLDEVADAVEAASAPLQRLEHALIPWVTFVVLPVFALTNAGVVVDTGLLDDLGSGIVLGVLSGLFVGKQVGIVAFAWLAVRLRLADLPDGVSWRQLHAVAVLGGVGFTMALFIGDLAFSDPASGALAKVGILAASVLSAVVGLALLWRAGARRPDATIGDPT
jgi:NhaA family Na+:H+ antiporter